MTPSERKLSASIAAHESWARTENRTARTAPARAALDAKFLEQAGGDPIRAAHLRKAHFARLALKSAQARRRSREQAEVADAADAELSALSGAPPGHSHQQSATGGSWSAEADRPPGHTACPATGGFTSAEAGDAA